MIVKKSCYSNIGRNAEYLDNDNKGIIIVEGKIIWNKKSCTVARDGGMDDPKEWKIVQ